MRDNMPNYLNMHNIDPGRIEPARIDTPPGNDSIRPGMNIGTIGVAGAGRRPAKMTMEQIEVFIRKLVSLEVDKPITFSDDLWCEIRAALSSLLPWLDTITTLPEEEK